MAGSLDAVTGQLSQVVGGVATSLQGLVAPLQGLGSVMPSITGAMSNLLGPITSLTDQTRQFVQALSPGTILAFDQAMQNLNATIGVAFEPIFQIFADTLARIASTLAPTFEALRPIVEQLAASLSERLLTVVVTLANVFEALMPFVKLAADLYQAMNPLIQAAVAILGALIESLLRFLAGLFGGADGMQDFARQLRDAIRDMVTAILTFVIQLADVFGFRDFGNAILRNLQPAQRGREQTAAIGQVQIQDFTAVARQLATAAAAASGRAGDQQQDATMRDIVEAVLRNRNDPPQWMTNLAANVFAMANDIRSILGAVREFWGNAFGPWTPEQREWIRQIQRDHPEWFGPNNAG